MEKKNLMVVGGVAAGVVGLLLLTAGRKPEPGEGEFQYSSGFFEMRPYIEIEPLANPLSLYAVYSNTIENIGSSVGTRVIKFHIDQEYIPSGSIGGQDFKVFELTLNPGEQGQFVFDPRINPSDLFVPQQTGNYRWYAYLYDNAGGESVHLSAT